MSISRNNDHPGNYGSIVFHCDADNCEEAEDTGYTTWDYASSTIKREGWYIMPVLPDCPHTSQKAWLHLCPTHGKAEFIRRKRAEEAPKKDPP